MFIWLDRVPGIFVPICCFLTFKNVRKEKGRDIYIHQRKQVRSRESPTPRDRKKENIKMYSGTKKKRYVSGYAHVIT